MFLEGGSWGNGELTSRLLRLNINVYYFCDKNGVAVRGVPPFPPGSAPGAFFYNYK